MNAMISQYIIDQTINRENIYIVYTYTYQKAFVFAPLCVHVFSKNGSHV